jgi:hypothetical protein
VIDKKSRDSGTSTRAVRCLDRLLKWPVRSVLLARLPGSVSTGKQLKADLRPSITSRVLARAGGK